MDNIDLLSHHVKNGTITSSSDLSLPRGQRLNFSAIALERHDFALFDFLNDEDPLFKDGGINIELHQLLDDCLAAENFTAADFLFSKATDPFSTDYMEEQLVTPLYTYAVKQVTYLINKFNDPLITIKTLEKMLDSHDLSDKPCPLKSISDVMEGYTGAACHDENKFLSLGDLDKLDISYKTLIKLVEPELAFTYYIKRNLTALHSIKPQYKSPSL